MNFSRTLAALPLLLALSACVSIDSRALREEVDAVATKDLRAAFSNVSFYRSQGELMASDSIAEALDAPARGADQAYIWRLSDKAVLVRFITEGKTVYERVYREGVDLKTLPDQRMVLSKKTECGGHDSPGFACGGGTATLFVDSNGALAIVESSGAAGALGFIPLVIYAKHLALFGRVQDAPPLKLD